MRCNWYTPTCTHLIFTTQWATVGLSFKSTCTEWPSSNHVSSIFEAMFGPASSVGSLSSCISFFPIFFFGFIYLFLLYNTVLVLPYIDMNQPWVYMSSQAWTPLLSPSPYHLSGSSQCTSPKHPVSCIEPRLAIHFLHDSIHVSMPFSQIIPLSPSPTESKSLFYTSVSFWNDHHERSSVLKGGGEISVFHTPLSWPHFCNHSTQKACCIPFQLDPLAFLS